MFKERLLLKELCTQKPFGAFWRDMALAGVKVLELEGTELIRTVS